MIQGVFLGIGPPTTHCTQYCFDRRSCAPLSSWERACGRCRAWWRAGWSRRGGWGGLHGMHEMPAALTAPVNSRTLRAQGAAWWEDTAVCTDVQQSRMSGAPSCNTLLTPTLLRVSHKRYLQGAADCARIWGAGAAALPAHPSCRPAPPAGRKPGHGVCGDAAQLGYPGEQWCCFGPADSWMACFVVCNVPT